MAITGTPAALASARTSPNRSGIVFRCSSARAPIIIDMTSYFPRMTVVGVVADSRLNALDKEVYPEVFWPMAQLPSAGRPGY